MGRYLIFTLILFFSLLSLSFCNKINEKKEQPKERQIDSSSVSTTKIEYFSFHSGLEGIIYRPVKGEKIPVVIGFDAHGDTHKMLNFLKPLADTFKFAIIIFSPKSNYHFKEFVRYYNEHYSSEFTDIYTIGFSAGSNLANICASYCGAKGIISLSIAIEPQIPVDVLYLTGTEDFNLAQIWQQYQYNSNSSLIIFYGKHQYPKIRDSQKIYRYPSFLIGYWIAAKSNYPNLDSLFQEAYSTSKIMYSDPYLYSFLLEYLIKTFEGKVSSKKIEEVKNELSAIKSTSAYKQYSTRWEHYLKLSLKDGDTLARLLTQKDWSFWKNYIAELEEKLSQTKNDFIEHSYYERKKALLGILCYVLGRESLRYGDPQFLTIIKVYQTIEPQNPDMAFMRACYYFRVGQLDSAKLWYSRAKEFGFSNEQLVEQLNCQNLR